MSELKLSRIACLLLTVLTLVWGAPDAGAETRVALVIGNSKYQNVPFLPNPINDAMDMSASLSRLGFTVKLLTNASYNEMRLALLDFGRHARGVDLAVVYFAGHGIQMGGDNWLIPVDAQLATDLDVSNEAIGLQSITRAVSNATKLGLVILDACRSNPFAPTMQSTNVQRAVDRGFSRVEPSNNVLVAYAARDGTTAQDGTGRNSPFTESLLKNIESPDLEITFLFRNVRDDVIGTTKGKQQPFLYGSLSKDLIYLKRSSDAALGPTPNPLVDAAAQAWAAGVRESNNVSVLEDFVRRYRDTIYGTMARARIDELKEARPAEASAPSRPSESGAGLLGGLSSLWSKPATAETSQVVRPPVSAATSTMQVEGAKPATSAAATMVAPASNPPDAAAQAWVVTQNTSSVAVLDDFIRKFGDTSLASVARARREELLKSQGSGNVALAAPQQLGVPAQRPASPAPESLPGGSKIVLQPSHRDGLEGGVYLASSFDFRLLAVSTNSSEINLWDMQSGKLVRTFKDPKGNETRFYGKPNEITLSADGERLLIDSNKSAILFDTKSGQTLRTFYWKWQDLGCVSLSPDARTVVGCLDQIMITDALTGKRIKVLSSEDYNLTFSADGSKMASTGAERSIRVWDKSSNKPLTLEDNAESVNAVAFVPGTNKLISGGEDKKIKVWDLNNRHSDVLGGHDRPVKSICVSRDGKFVVSGSDDGTLKLWNLASRSLVRTFEHGSKVTAVSFAPNGNIVSGGSDNLVKLWSSQNGNLLATLVSNEESWAVVGVDGRFMAEGDPRKLFKVVMGNSNQSTDDFIAAHRRNSLAEVLSP